MQTKELLKQRCDTMLESLLGPEFGKCWWHTKNRAFGGLTPEGQWIQDPNSVYSYLLSHCSGDYH
jgi:hypothetical protein